MSAPAPVAGLSALRSRLDECVHCGFCLPTCPTYAELGAEADSPRGRLHLLRALLDSRLQPDEETLAPLDRCLDCRACETACPSGVRYGEILEGARAALEPVRRRKRDERSALRSLLRGWLASRQRLARRFAPLRWADALGLSGLARAFGQSAFQPPLLRNLVRALPPSLDPPFLRHAPALAPARGARRGRVALFVGCVMEQTMGHVHEAAVRVLTRNGFDVLIPREQQCCGALHVHNGDAETAGRLADSYRRLFPVLAVDAVVVDAAGCGSRLQEIDTRAVDITAWLARAGIVPPTHEVRRVAVYDEPCHLVHAQRVSEEPRSLLRQIPGLELRPLVEADWCCGAAGLYAAQQPDLAGRLLTRKLGHIRETGADLVLTANPGCEMQLANGAREAGLALEVRHVVEALDWAYGR